MQHGRYFVLKGYDTMKKILIRADDLGMSKGVNFGIAQAVNEGIVRSVGVMSNMPDARHGLDLLKRESISLGLHCCISTGRPLLPADRVPSLVDENGNFKRSSAYRHEDDFAEYEQVRAEIEAQLIEFMRLTGKKPDYFEGHAVASPTFFRAMRDVARQYECDYLEMKWAEAVPFKGARLQGGMAVPSPDYDPYELLRQTLETSLSEDVIPMLILHPGFVDLPLVQASSLLKPRILEADMASSQKAKELLRRCAAQVVAYHEL